MIAATVLLVPQELVFGEASQEQTFMVKSREQSDTLHLEFTEYDRRVFAIQPASISLKPKQEQLVRVRLLLNGTEGLLNGMLKLKQSIKMKEARKKLAHEIPVTIIPAMASS